MIKKAQQANKKHPLAVKLQKRLEKVQARVKEQTDLNAELDSWGFNSHVISYVIKVRVLEDLIECAQKCTIKPDVPVERELALMKALAKQTWEDIQYFLSERDKQKWRTWDSPRLVTYKKPAVTFDDGPSMMDSLAI